MASRVRRVLTSVTTWCAHAYPIGALGVIVTLRFGAASSAFLTAALYLPPQGYLLPLVLALPLALLRGPRAAWLSLLAGTGVAYFGLMGGQVNLPASSPNARTVITMNVDSAHAGVPGIVEELLSHQPDIVFLQEIGWRGEELARGLRAALPFVIVSGQFVVASRFELSELTLPEPKFVRGRVRLPNYVRVRINLPEGSVAAYTVHPVSPRPAFGALRKGGFRSQISSGQLFAESSRDIVWKNVEIREFELSSAAARARQEMLPVVLAGDLNLPHNSRLLSGAFAFLRDTFSQAGFGTGYTYPSKRPFLRLDRILVSSAIRPVNVAVNCMGHSDHLCVITKLEFSRR
jgi:vancomycin resistance protein VanJ